MPNPNLSEYLFWDTDISKIDYEKNARHVIERVVTMGQLSDWQEMQKYYSKEQIVSSVKRSRNLDPKTLALLSAYYNIPRKDFRWYLQTRSKPELWIYSAD